MVLGKFERQPWVPVIGLASMLLVAAPVAGRGQAEPDRISDEGVRRIVRQFSTDGRVDRAFAGILVERLGLEYRTPVSELRWAAEQVTDTPAETGGFGWGDVAVLAYLQASTGWSFSELVDVGAHKDFPFFVDTLEMSHQRMAASFETLADQVIRERNSMMFDRIRSAPRSGGLEDLGAGFGLFQESLDFRQLDPPGPTKVHEAGTGVIVFQGGAP